MSGVAVLPITVVDSGFTRVVKRFGRISRTLMPGVNFVNPLFDSYVSVDWSFEQAGSRVYGVDIPTNSLRYDPRAHECVTRDQITVMIDIQVEFRVEDVVRAVTSSPNLFASIETLCRASLLESVRSLPLADLVPSAIKTAVSTNLIEASGSYGFSVTRVYVEKITIPAEIRSATVQVEAQRRQKLAELAKLEQESSIQLSQQRLKLELTQASAIEQQLVATNEAKKRKAESIAAVEVDELLLQQQLKRERALRQLELEMYREKLAILAESTCRADVLAEVTRADALTAIAKDPAAKLVMAPNDAILRMSVTQAQNQQTHQL
jgi:regulator of protease activity HflC (stomatin/prohibitin superfamily)